MDYELVGEHPILDILIYRSQNQSIFDRPMPLLYWFLKLLKFGISIKSALNFVYFGYNGGILMLLE